MRKTTALILATIVLFLLAACGNIRQVQGYFLDLEIYSASVDFSIEISDPKEEVTGNIIVEIYKDLDLIDSEILTSELDYENIIFRNLKPGEEYKLVIVAMIGREAVVIEELLITTKADEVIHIKTVKDFLKMADNREGTFILDNDLDFGDEKNLTPLFTSATRSFRGSFDGKGYTIKNLNYSVVGQYGGIFGYVDIGEIKNLNIENINIGSEDAHITTSLTSRVGFLAGVVSSTNGSIENITIKNSSMYVSSSSTNLLYVGGLVGELKTKAENITIENSNLNIITRSYGKLKLGGLVGYLDDNAQIKQAKANVNINYSLEAAFGNGSKRDFSLSIGGAVGDYNSRKPKGLSEVIYEGDININLDFGSREEQTGAYRLYVGGVAGLVYGQLDNVLAKSNITVNHESNEFEEAVNKRFYVGGIAGQMETNYSSKSVLNFNNETEINLNISDDIIYYIGYTAAFLNTSSSQEMGYISPDSIYKNGEIVEENIVSDLISNINSFFDSNYINEYLQ